MLKTARTASESAACLDYDSFHNSTVIANVRNVYLLRSLGESSVSRRSEIGADEPAGHFHDNAVLRQLKVMRAFPCELQGEVCNSEAHLEGTEQSGTSNEYNLI